MNSITWHLPQDLILIFYGDILAVWGLFFSDLAHVFLKVTVLGDLPALHPSWNHFR